MRSLSQLTRFVLCGLTLGCGCVDAADPVLPDGFRARIAEGVDTGAWQSVAVGLVRDGQTKSEFFGHLEGKDGAPLDGHSRIELGPLSEAYVGLLLADLVISGKVRLNDTLADALPNGFAFADSALGQLSLEQLATFHSGLPPIPPNLFPRSELDPFVDYDVGALRTLLGHGRMQTDLGGGVLDASVLAYALEQRTGGDFAALLRSRILAELGLEHTGFGDGELVAGHYLGDEAAPWHFGALAPARGLRSDLEDQLKFAQAFLRPSEGALQAALLLARQARGDAALGWHVAIVKSDDQDWPLLWNGGSSGGHASFVGLRADRQQAVVLMSNTSADLSALGLALLTDSVPPALPPRLRRLEPDRAADFGGLYRFDSNGEVIVRPGGDGLTMQYKGQFPLQLVAYDDDAFSIVGLNAQVTFQRNADKHVERLLLHQGGVNLSAVRLSQRAPLLVREAVVSGATQIAACVGDFALGDTVQLRLSQQGNGMAWQLSGIGPRSLVAFGPQRYASSDGVLELLCSADEKGQVGALKLNVAGGEVEVSRIRWSHTSVAAGQAAQADASTAKK